MRFLRPPAFLVAVAAVVAIGASGLAAPIAAQAATDDSSVTVKWAGGNDERVQQYQPDHPDETDTSGDYGDFKDLQVTVDRTTELTDGAVSVSYTGMPQTQTGDAVASTSRSYLTMMQCWGQDPHAADFAETCQWGGRWNSNVQNSIMPYLTNARIDGSTVSRGTTPFRSALGGGYTEGGTLPEVEKASEFYGVLTSNEVSIAWVNADGTGKTSFETQSAASSPHLGCGAGPTGGRCWLVIVPYGNHQQIADPADSRYGTTTEEWGDYGSPFSAEYTRWNERMVIPLDFRAVGASCAAGAAEIRTTGSVLVSKAMGSWQRQLCNDGLYSLVTNGDDVTRKQLLTGSSSFIYTAEPITPDAATEAKSDVVYAPMAATGLVVGYNFRTSGGKVTTADISPRLLAKLLTQSYPHQVAGVASSIQIAAGATWEHLGWADGLVPQRVFWDDPDVISAFHLDDPNNPSSRFPSALPLPQVLGPQTADSIAQLWAWIQSDDSARAFLEGQPDAGNHGMTVNPYYLQKGDPKAVISPVYCVNGLPALWNGSPCTDGQKVLGQDGRPISRAVGIDVNLAKDRIDSFRKADETQAPYFHASDDQPGYGPDATSRIDALSFPSYASSFDQVAQRVFRGDNARLSAWNKQSVPAAFKPELPGVPQDTFVLGILDASTAATYDLAVARLQVANKPGTFVAPDVVGQRSALDAQKPTAVPGVTETDVDNLPDTAYPLTSIVYGAANLNAPALADATLRGSYAKLIRFAAQGGQHEGWQAGDLPPGYAPLTEPLVAEALAAADVLEAGARPAAQQPSQPSTATVAVPPPARPPAGSPASGPTSQTKVTTTTAAAAEPTGAAVGSVALGGSLVAGIAGLIGAPLLLRRRSL